VEHSVFVIVIIVLVTVIFVLVIVILIVLVIVIIGLMNKLKKILNTYRRNIMNREWPDI